MRRHVLVRSFLACVVAASVLPAAARAQLAQGDRVRVLLGAQPIAEGVFAGTDSGGYALVLSGSDTARVPFGAGYSAKRFVRSIRGFGAIEKGVGIGAGIGLGLLGLTRLGANGHDDGIGYALALCAGMVTTVTGFVVGTLVAISQLDQWERVSFALVDSAGGAPPR